MDQELQHNTAMSLVAFGDLGRVLGNAHKKWWCCLQMAQETQDAAAAKLSTKLLYQIAAAIRAVMAQPEFSGMESMPEEDQ